MYENSWIQSGRHKTNTEIARELNIAPILDRICDQRKKLMQHVKRMPCCRLPRLQKKLHHERKKEPRKTAEQTAGCVRPERVKKRPGSLKSR
jgi:hypothetical protein